MRIGIDTRLAHYRRDGGIAQYTLRLLDALVRLDGADQFVVLRHRRERLANLVAPARHVRARRLLTPSHHRFEQWTLPVELSFARLDVLHCPDFIPPFRRRCPAVITVHDLAFMRYPHLLTPESAAYYGQIARAVRSAEQIIAVSEATRRDLVQLVGADERKITVIYEAADAIYQPITNYQTIQSVLSKYQLHQPFLLFVSTIEPRKNLPMLLRAFRLLLDQCQTNAQLAVAGRPGWLADNVAALADELQLSEHVKFLGPVPSADLAMLYNATTMYVMPSLYEGFGLGLVEAMQCGAPVLASNVSALPEVAGEAGICLDPNDPTAWADAMRRVLEDEPLRNAMRQKSLRRAQMFSWD
ncbi:MAG: glycosyltransferase family 1 protein, partial [Chloroflexota bacterium]